MSDITVTGNRLSFRGKTFECSIGKAGFATEKREGDNCTPLGEFALREIFYRSDKVERPQSVLPANILSENDGWCDAPGDSNYNRKIKLPYAASHEKLWRSDDIYDVIVPLGYNDSPVIPGKGSAIFLHLARDNYAGTEGCVALKLPDLLEILRDVDLNSRIIIKP